MAYTVNQSTTGVQGAADELIYVTEDTTNTGEENYRYVCRISVGADVVLFLRQLPNNADAAVFNIQSVVRSYVSQDECPYDLGITDPSEVFSLNTQALRTVTLRFGYEYSVTAGADPTTVLLSATDTTVRIVNGTFYTQGDSYPLASTAAQRYQISTANNLFLSDIPATGEYRTPVADRSGLRSRAVLSFLNGQDVSSMGPRYLWVRYYNGSTALNSGYIQNSTANGGTPPASGLSDAASLLYVGVGPANLQAQTINTDLRPGATGNDGWTHYDVTMSSSNLTGFDTTKSYRFVRNACCKYWDSDAAYTLHWWNSKGGVDSLPCDGMSTESQSMERNSYRVQGGNGFNADGDGLRYAKNSWEGGKRAGRVQTTTTLQLSVHGGNADIYTPLIRSLMNSERMYISGSGTFGLSTERLDTGIMQCTVTEMQKTYRKSVNGPQESYTLTVELSRRRPNT